MFPYIGAKHYLHKFLLNILPDDYEKKTYVEVFGGSAKFLFYKKPSKIEVLNDKDDYIVNLYRVLFYNYKEFKNYFLHLSLCSRTEFDRIKEKLRNNDFNDAIEKAYCYLYYLSYSFSTSLKNFDSSFEALKKKKILSILKIIYKAKKRLNNVIIENLDFRELIDKYDSKDTIFYCDPPYYGLNLYRLSFSEKDHLDLYTKLKNIKGKFILSYNEADEILNLYKDFNIEKIAYESKSLRKGTQYNELIIYNYKKHKSNLELFDIC